MFSGIVEEAAPVVALRREQGNLHLTLSCSFTSELKIDQSVAHNGVCLTVVGIDGDTYTVTAIQETLDRSNLGLLKTGDKVKTGQELGVIYSDPEEDNRTVLHFQIRKESVEVDMDTLTREIENFTEYISYIKNTL